MDELFKQIITRIAKSVFPFALLFPFSYQPLIPPPPTPTPTITIMPSLSPTSTVSPTPTQTPHPTISPSPTQTVTPRPTNTPTLTNTPTSIPITSSQLDEWFTTYSNQFSVDRQKLWNVAVCESNLRADATNGDYGGMYQFSTNTWIATRNAMNLDTNPSLRFNPEEAIKTAAFKISTVGLSPWPTCGK